MRIRGYIFVTSFILLFNSATAEGQQGKKIPLVFEVQYAAGKIPSMYPGSPKNSFTNGAEFHIGYQTYGTKNWHRLFNYPRMGVSFIYQDLGSSRVLGQQISIVPTVYFSTALKENAKIFAELRYGLGMAIFNRPYDSIKNPENRLAGSRVAWQFTVGANLRWQFSPLASLQLGGLWYHASNGHTKLPNVGVNSYAGYVSILVHPFNKIARTHQRDSMALDKKWHVNFRLGIGWHERGSGLRSDDKKTYPAYTASVYASKRLWKIFMAKVGFTYRYYPLYKSFLQDYQITDSKLTLKSSAFILFIGNEFLLGHFAISLEAGLNLYKPAYKPFFDKFEYPSKFGYIMKQYISTRFGVNYYILDPYLHPRNNVFIGAYVSANMGQAEFLEMNIGYVF